MEFYFWLEILTSARASFNSQRDGILPVRVQVIYTQTLVSIPNGMEFYACRSYRQQRGRRFQFPTGWNSTRDRNKQGWTTDVSIPNGMEFYYKQSIVFVYY